MLHGCRSDLILKCLINFKKGRNLYSYLLDFNNLVKNFNMKKIFNINIEISSDV
jgi:hypothetical protein